MKIKAKGLRICGLVLLTSWFTARVCQAVTYRPDQKVALSGVPSTMNIETDPKDGSIYYVMMALDNIIDVKIGTAKRVYRNQNEIRLMVSKDILPHLNQHLKIWGKLIQADTRGPNSAMDSALHHYVDIKVDHFEVLSTQTEPDKKPVATHPNVIRMTQGDLFLINNAINTYQGDHGKNWPKSLDELKGHYLDKIPNEFFTPSNRTSNVFDGKGGWYYDTASHQVHVNLNGEDSMGMEYRKY